MNRIPILRLGQILITSIQVDLHDALVTQLQEDLLTEIENGRTMGCVIDISGVGLMDTFTARAMVATAQMTELMGVRTLVAGVRPEVALTLVQMGFDTGNVRTVNNLERAVALLNA